MKTKISKPKEEKEVFYPPLTNYEHIPGRILKGKEGRVWNLTEDGKMFLIVSGEAMNYA